MKAPANAIMQRKQRQLGQKQFDSMFYEIDCCAAIHGWRPEYEWTMNQMKVE